MGTSSVIVLPKPVVDGFNLGRGQRLELIVRDDGIYIPLTEQPAENLETTDDTSKREE